MSSSPAALPVSTLGTRRLAIIVADDVEEIRDLLKSWLEDLGHDVECAASGWEVVRLAKKRVFDLVITDVLMPDGDGLDVITALRKTRAEPRVLAISGGGKYMLAANCLRIAKGVGADEVLLKPFKREQLLEAIDRALHDHVPRREKARSGA